MNKIIYIAIIAVILLPLDMMGLPVVTAPVALLAGLVFAFACKNPYPAFNKKCSKYLLQVAVVCLGFGMNLQESLRSGADGMLFTVVSVVGVMALGILLGYSLRINRKTAYLISSGTAICGGSAIAAVGPVLRADEKEMAVSLGVIFILNAVALFIFPPLGHMLDMSQAQFGTWAAIAIHDTSSVVGAGEVYGEQALQVATLIKLTRALWIIPLAVATMFYIPRRLRQGVDSVVHIHFHIGHGGQHLPAVAAVAHRCAYMGGTPRHGCDAFPHRRFAVAFDRASGGCEAFVAGCRAVGAHQRKFAVCGAQHH